MALSDPNSSGEADIRGIDIDKLAKGFAELEPNIIKGFIANSKTKAREIRWYQKESGFLDTSDTTNMSGSRTMTSYRSRPEVVEQSWDRETSYVKKFFLSSPLLSDEDIKDSDIDVLGTNIHDIVRGVQRRVGARIFEIMFNCLASTPTQPLTNGAVTIQNTAATAGWDQTATANPILDITNGAQLIRAKGYDPKGGVLGMNSIEHKYLLNYLISVKGSSIPSFSSEKLKTGVIMEILGWNVIVDELLTTDWVYQWVPNRAATWKSFMPITSVAIKEPLIGTTIRVAEEGECILTDPNAVHVISGTIG